MNKKFNQSEPDKEKVFGESNNKNDFYPPDPPKDKTVEKEGEEKKEVSLTFKENRAYELHIGRQIYRFEGRESKIVPRSVLVHKDFTERISKKFVIREVN